MHSAVLGGLRELRDAGYFRHRAEQTRQLSLIMWQPGVRKTLLELARDYDELAEDLERGTAAIRHPELLPRRSA
jgi:hypothetical protein